MSDMSPSDIQTMAAEAYAFRQLVQHLQVLIAVCCINSHRCLLRQNRKDVQNIDIMNLSGFCRNCLSKW